MKKLQNAARLFLVIYIIVFSVSFYNESKQNELMQCVEYTDGTDTDCIECYYKVYGEYPSNEQ
jgi:hypothetical protein